MTQILHIPSLDGNDARELLERLFPKRDDCSGLIIACDSVDFSASAIARAVEDCDAHLLNLNVLEDDAPGGRKLIALRVDHRNPAAVARSIERYGMTVMEMSPSSDDDADTDPYDDTTRTRVNQLLRYLDI